MLHDPDRGAYVAAPECECGGAGIIGTITIQTPDGRLKDVVQICRTHRPDTAARVPRISDLTGRHLRAV